MPKKEQPGRVSKMFAPAFYCFVLTVFKKVSQNKKVLSQVKK